MRWLTWLVKRGTFNGLKLSRNKEINKLIGL